MQTPTLVNIVDLYKDVRGVSYNGVHAPTLTEFIKQHSIQVAYTCALGRGTARFTTVEEANRVRAACVAKEPDAAPDAPSIHLGSLETKVDRLCERVRAVEDAISVLVKATNLHADRTESLYQEVNKLLTSLGEPPHA